MRRSLICPVIDPPVRIESDHLLVSDQRTNREQLTGEHSLGGASTCAHSAAGAPRSRAHAPVRTASDCKCGSLRDIQGRLRVRRCGVGSGRPRPPVIATVVITKSRCRERPPFFYHIYPFMSELLSLKPGSIIIISMVPKTSDGDQ